MCGTKTLVQVHHIKPFAEFPELELEYTNLVTLCMFKSTCHFLIGHGGNWDCYNPYLIVDVNLIRSGSPLNYVIKKANDYKIEIKSKE